MSKAILVVDDSATVRQQVSSALRQAGFETLEAADGKEAFAMITSPRPIDLVICDVNMPHMNGIELVEQVKTDPGYKALPILMLTTEGQPALVRRAKDAGAVGWIIKPFNANQLVLTAKHITKA